MKFIDRRLFGLRTLRGSWNLLTVTLAVSGVAAGWSGASVIAAERTIATADKPRFTPSVYPRFADWKAACDSLPSNRSLKFSLPSRRLWPLKNFGEFAEVLDAFFAFCKSNDLARPEKWLGKGPVASGFFNIDAAYFARPAIPFQPFAQRLSVEPGAQVFFHGDLHGDIRSLVGWLSWLNEQGYLDGFRIARPDVYLAMLGDFTDRGIYGVEVLYTLLRLKVENPDHVFLVRGNHEDIRLAAGYGFLDEARAKYGRAFDVQRVMRLYDFLPVVLYLGCGDNFIQCNHGGMEPGFNPAKLLNAPESVSFQLLGPIREAQFLKDNTKWLGTLPEADRRLALRSMVDYLPESPTTPTVLGFMWNDFTIWREEPQFGIDPGRAYVYGEATTRVILEHASTGRRRLHAVFRAHQHSSAINPMMRRLNASRGIFRHWQEGDSAALKDTDPAGLIARLDHSKERSIPANSVWTFNVVPDSTYGEGCDFNFDTFGILTTASAVADWRLRVVNLTHP